MRARIPALKSSRFEFFVQLVDPAAPEVIVGDEQLILHGGGK
jgi:hypothetical protein